jgi:hypothetical protein
MQVTLGAGCAAVCLHAGWPALSTHARSLCWYTTAAAVPSISLKGCRNTQPCTQAQLSCAPLPPDKPAQLPPSPAHLAIHHPAHRQGACAVSTLITHAARPPISIPSSSSSSRCVGQLTGQVASCSAELLLCLLMQFNCPDTYN